MKFLCDVHISYKVVHYLKEQSFEAVHVNEILDKWYTKDSDICFYADQNDLIIISKDVDFKDSFLLKNTPKKLVKINLGNISTDALINSLSVNLHAIEKLNSAGKFMVELDKDVVTFIKK